MLRPLCPRLRVTGKSIPKGNDEFELLHTNLHLSSECSLYCYLSIKLLSLIKKDESGAGAFHIGLDCPCKIGMSAFSIIYSNIRRIPDNRIS
jgi:hypothetical protein